MGSGGYPCCCPGVTSSSGGVDCGICHHEFAPSTIAVNVLGIEAGDPPNECACGDLDGIYVVEWLDPATTDPADWCDITGGNCCYWGLQFDAICGYDRVVLGYCIDAQLGGRFAIFWLLPADCMGEFDARILEWSTLIGNATRCFACTQMPGASDIAGCRNHIFGDDPFSFAQAFCDTGGDTSCCGMDVPVAGSTCTATIAGTAGCAGNPSHPNDGDVNLDYMGTGNFTPCAGFSWTGGEMKWIGSSLGEAYLLVVTCSGPNINVEFFWWKCNGGGGALGDTAIWTGVALAGSCDLSGMVLTLASDPAGCIDPGSTVTLSNFVF